MEMILRVAATLLSFTGVFFLDRNRKGPPNFVLILTLSAAMRQRQLSLGHTEWFETMVKVGQIPSRASKLHEFPHQRSYKEEKQT